MGGQSKMRVVSLIASGTEIVHGIGRGDWLVGRSHECDYPAEVNQLPQITEPKFSTQGSSRDIDDRVREVLETGLSVYRVDADKLRSLRPDVVVTQDQCEVCAVTLKDVEQGVCGWMSESVKIVSLRPEGLEDVWRDITRVADALICSDRGEELIAQMRARMTEIKETAESSRGRPTIACIEWIDPLMAAANWMPSLVEMAGGKNLFGEAGNHSPYIDWDDFVAADPEVIIVLPCGFVMSRVVKEARHLQARSGWNDLRAVRSGRVFVTDGHQYFNRPGPRLVESLEILAEILHPELFVFGHRDRAWAPLKTAC